MWTSLLRINTPTCRHVHSILNKIRCKRRKKKPTSTTYFTCAIFPGISCNFLIHFFFRAGILQKIMGEKSVATPKSENCSGSSQRGFSQSLSRVNSHWRRLVNEHKKLERFSIDVVSLVLKRFLGISAVVEAQEVMGRTKNGSRCSAFQLSLPLPPLRFWALLMNLVPRLPSKIPRSVWVRGGVCVNPNSSTFATKSLWTLATWHADFKRAVCTSETSGFQRLYFAVLSSPINPDGATYVYSFKGVFIDQFSFRTILTRV